MAKLVALAAVLVALLAMSAATASRSSYDESSSRQQGGRQQQQKCQQQIQQQRQELRHCARYLDQESNDRRIAMKSSMFGLPQQQHLSQCCDALQNFDRQCRCEAVKETLRILQQEEEEDEEQERSQGRGQGQEQEQGEQLDEQIMQKAKQLPRICNLEPQQCQIRAFYF